jgi:hypothetical protein
MCRGGLVAEILEYLVSDLLLRNRHGLVERFERCSQRFETFDVRASESLIDLQIFHSAEFRRIRI